MRTLESVTRSSGDLSDVNIKILRQFVQDRGTYPLQSDIRQSLRTVARRLEMDEATVRHRVRKMHESGFMKGWFVFPNPRLFYLRVAHARGDVPQPVQQTVKDDAIRK